MESGFLKLIENIYRSDTLSEEDKKQLIEKVECDAVSAYMRKIDASLSLGLGTTDGPLIAASLKLHYDLITKAMSESSLAYTDNLTKRLASKIKYVNITIDLDALKKSLDTDSAADNSDDLNTENNE